MSATPTTGTRSSASPRSPRPTRGGADHAAQYVERMKEGQEQIYYMTGESRQRSRTRRTWRRSRAKGFEVLLLTDPVDEMWVGVGARIRRQAAPVDRQGRGRPRHRGGEEGGRGRARAAGEGLRRPADLDGRRAERAGQGGTAVLPADHVARPASSATPTSMTPALEQMYRAWAGAVPRQSASSS